MEFTPEDARRAARSATTTPMTDSQRVDTVKHLMYSYSLTRETVTAHVNLLHSKGITLEKALYARLDKDGIKYQPPQTAAYGAVKAAGSSEGGGGGDATTKKDNGMVLALRPKVMTDGEVPSKA